ncbi:MAG: DNA repair protein RecO [Planctomycetaceae bacterium]|nr:DNA repair protein RecO [Planctomycetaceae bacterium]
MSSSEKTEGIVIRQTDFSETSRVVTFFTHDFGKITVLAKGAKRLKGSFEAAIDLLTRCQIVFLHKSTSSLDILTEAKLVSRFQSQSRDVNVNYAGLYVAELLQSCSEEFDPYPHWYEAAVHTLEHLQAGEDYRICVLRFELQTLQTLGLLPEFEQCQCGRPVLDDRERWSLWIQQGVLLCSQCRQPEHSSRPLSGELLTMLRALAHTPVEQVFTGEITSAQFKTFRHLLTALISQILDRRPTMLGYLQF